MPTDDVPPHLALLIKVAETVNNLTKGTTEQQVYLLALGDYLERQGNWDASLFAKCLHARRDEMGLPPVKPSPAVVEAAKKDIDQRLRELLEKFEGPAH